MKKIEATTEQFITTYMKALKDGTAAVFAGAGLSKAAGFVDWKDLLKSIAHQLGLNIDKESDLIALTQYHINEHGTRHRINQLIVDEFSRRASITENHKILSGLPITIFWTTNYDRLIEDALNQAGKTPDVKITPENLAINLPKRDAVVYKMHGDINDSDRAVFTKEDYENFNNDRQLFSTALQGDIVSKTFLFIGFSFSDPNIDYILSRIRVLLGKNQRNHYCFLRKVHRKDFKNNKDFIYAQTKQNLQIKDLKRYSITALLFDDYADFTEVLRIIENRIKRAKVFISGSAEQYSPWGEQKSIRFVHALSKELNRNEFTVITGFGLGIGSAVINGVLEQVYSTNYHHLDDQLILRPFPQFATGNKSLPDLWKEYRSEMISKAGIAIFLFGNKKNERGEIVNANGVLKEYEIAISNGLKVIPVGLTGYASADLWKKVWQERKRLFGNKKKIHNSLKKLNDPKTSLTKTVKIIIDLVKLIQREP
ncbi:MAG: hypothetical protein COW12_00575 [Candidatus Omnitrophica bacterium CG12_big_fil_rev_8_21_14_0_65_45_16]|nr:MAG: hypothetical protein COW12_00575 [Candidatus Omnitrophica bacterium CG12_big_fil_rev_8_21_14_0_65_45_16]